jgi:betaine reductase
MKIADEFDLLHLDERFVETIRPLLANHPLTRTEDLGRLGDGVAVGQIAAEVERNGALPLYLGNQLVGCLVRGHDEDENLAPAILLENLACKATGILALRHLLGPDSAAVDFVLGCGEEGVGDRYQRGAGNLAKAMAELAGCLNSSGADVKAFCCSPVHALVIGASLVHAGLFRNVAVVGGGSLAKLGMKMRGHLANGMPIMEDVLAAIAFWLGEDDRVNPHLRLDTVGKHDVAAGSSQQAIMESLVVRPLERVGLRILEVERFATEMHNPEITEPAGSGNVPRNNYRMIGGLAVLRGEMSRSELDWFERHYGMPGFSPTQGHVAAAVPFLGHARNMILGGKIDRAMFVAKGSLFLAKMTKLSDGMSFVLQKNEGGRT